MTSIRERVLRSTEISEFQRKVYLELLDIPEGETISYGELARRIGCRSAQAVGLDKKKELLDEERNHLLLPYQISWKRSSKVTTA